MSKVYDAENLCHWPQLRIRVNLFQPCVAFYIETSYLFNQSKTNDFILQSKTKDWILYETQHWAEEMTFLTLARNGLNCSNIFVILKRFLSLKDYELLQEAFFPKKLICHLLQNLNFSIQIRASGMLKL